MTQKQTTKELWLKHAANWDHIADTHTSETVRADAKKHADFCREQAQKAEPKR